MNKCCKRTEKYLCLIISIDNKSSIQGETIKEYVLAIDDHGRSLWYGATLTNFSFYVSKSWGPFWAPCDAWPQFHLLSIEDVSHRVSYVHTSLQIHHLVRKLSLRCKLNIYKISSITLYGSLSRHFLTLGAS